VPPGPEVRYGVHFLSSGPGVTPLLSPLAPTLGVVPPRFLMFSQKLLQRSMSLVGAKVVAPLTFEVASVDGGVEWTVELSVLGVYRRDVSGRVRYAHKSASPFARKCLESLAGEHWTEVLKRNPEIDSRGAFPVASLTNWPQLKLDVGTMTAEESADAIAQDIAQHVLPFIATVSDDAAYFARLMSNEPPMPWTSGQPLHRLAEAAWLAAELKRPTATLDRFIEENRELLERNLRGISVATYLSTVRIAIAHDA
jgi:hypothetical protein